ncbi:hypothetical protein ACB092_12G122900 [Castanea dentata]
MQSIYLPSRLLDNLDRLNRNFLWRSSEFKRKMHWVGWSTVTQPKIEGGLGIQTAKGKNLAYLAKLNRRFHSEKDALWVQVLRKKYMTRSRVASPNESSLPISRIWKAMRKGLDIFAKGTRWSLGRDITSIFGLIINWTSNSPLRAIVQGPLTRGEEDIKVKDIVSDLGWDWRKISIILPSQIVMEIRAMPHSCVASSEDWLIWAATSNGQFNLSSAYLLSIQQLEPHQYFNGNWIWKVNVLPRVQFFI